MTFNIEPFSDRPFELAEGPHWHAEHNKLYFVDILRGIVGTFDSNKSFRLLYKDDSFTTAVLPVECDDQRIMVTCGNALYSVNVESGQKTLIAKVDKNDVRFNDAKCDSRGRLWLGTMGLETLPGVLEKEKGSFYSYSSDNNKLKERLNKVSLSNGIAWSLDDKQLYFIDSVKREIYAFDFDVEAGNLDNRRVLVNMNDNAEFTANELPDGMTIDVNGNLWVAMFNGKRIVNIDTNTGKVIQSIDMPTTQITSACFGGPNLSELYVTSASKFLDDDTRTKEQFAGYIFKVTSSNPNFKGFRPNVNFKSA